MIGVLCWWHFSKFDESLKNYGEDPWFKSKNGQHKIPWDELKQKHGCCFVCGSSGEITCFQISCFHRLPGLFRRKWLEHPKRNWAQAFWCGGKESWSFWIKGIRHFFTCNMIYVTVSLVFQFFRKKCFLQGEDDFSSSFIGLAYVMVSHQFSIWKKASPQFPVSFQRLVRLYAVSTQSWSMPKGWWPWRWSPTWFGVDLYPKPPIIMVQWKTTLKERKLVLEIYPFFTKNHDYGRKGRNYVSFWFGF